MLHTEYVLDPHDVGRLGGGDEDRGGSGGGDDSGGGGDESIVGGLLGKGVPHELSVKLCATGCGSAIDAVKPSDAVSYSSEKTTSPASKSLDGSSSWIFHIEVKGMPLTLLSNCIDKTAP